MKGCEKTASAGGGWPAKAVSDNRREAPAFMDGENLLPVFTWKGCPRVTDSGRWVLGTCRVLRDLT